MVWRRRLASKIWRRPLASHAEQEQQRGSRFWSVPTVRRREAHKLYRFFLLLIQRVGQAVRPVPLAASVRELHIVVASVAGIQGDVTKGGEVGMPPIQMFEEPIWQARVPPGRAVALHADHRGAAKSYMCCISVIVLADELAQLL